jgi:hypothetical protein
MGKAHETQKTAEPKCETNALATRKKRQKANSSNTKLYSNPCGPMQFSYGAQPPIPTLKSSSAFNPRLPDPF